MPRSIDSRDSFGGCTKLASICTINVGIVQADTSLLSNESNIEIDTYADTTVLG